jgi:hypothetical protein
MEQTLQDHDNALPAGCPVPRVWHVNWLPIQAQKHSVQLLTDEFLSYVLLCDHTQTYSMRQVAAKSKEGHTQLGNIIVMGVKHQEVNV